MHIAAFCLEPILNHKLNWKSKLGHRKYNNDISSKSANHHTTTCCLQSFSSVFGHFSMLASRHFSLLVGFESQYDQNFASAPLRYTVRFRNYHLLADLLAFSQSACACTCQPKEFVSYSSIPNCLFAITCRNTGKLICCNLQ